MVNSKSTVFIVDDDEASSRSLRWLVESVDLNAEVFRSAAEFIDGYDPTMPGCLVLDVRMPGMSGLELQQHLRERGIELPIIFVTGHGDIPMAVRAVKAGAVDFFEKPFKQQELLDLIHKAIARDAERRYTKSRQAEAIKRLDPLTPREREVLQLIAAGNLNKVVAAKLGLSARTVEAHRASIMKKLEAKCASDLIRIAIELNIGLDEQ
jgi:FixJ family two-component response regulator